MPRRKKIDVVIEAVHYMPDGQIGFVRAYERRGAIWSDHLLIPRAGLVERLQRGQQIVVGRRKIYWGSAFETDRQVTLAEKAVITEGQAGRSDTLTGAPIF